jgi:hypothetical protein
MSPARIGPMAALLALACLLLSCTRPDPLTSGFAPLLTHLDSNQDGAVSSAEYAAVAYAAPAFDAVDANTNGVLDASELSALVRTQDPVYFDNRQEFARQGTRHFQTHRPARPGAYEARILRDLYRFEAAEILARGGNPPDDVAIAKAAATGSLSSPESVLVLEGLNTSAAAVGVELPKRLWPQRQ